jgi:hypothetical protein
VEGRLRFPRLEKSKKFPFSVLIFMVESSFSLPGGTLLPIDPSLCRQDIPFFNQKFD